VNLSVFHKSAPTDASSDRLALARPRPKIHSIGNRPTELCGRILLLDPLEPERRARAVLSAARDPHSGNDLVAEARSDCVALVLGDPERPRLSLSASAASSPGNRPPVTGRNA